MYTSKDEKVLAPAVIEGITPTYQKIMATTTQHSQVIVAELKVKSELFTQDLEEVSGGVR